MLDIVPHPAPTSTQPRPVRVMVVDDSAIVRGLIVQMLEKSPEVAIAARASNGEAALAELGRHEVDVIVLDLEMPVMDGMTALPLLLAKQPGVRVVVASTLSQRNARISLDALQKGAADYVPKPETGSLVNAAEFERELVGKVLALGRRRSAAGVGSVPATAPRPRSAVRPGVIAIGGSTGAPPVLLEVMAGLKDNVSQPILITQHMPATFTALLAEQIERAGGRPCAEARDGEPILPGRAYVAPGGWHMTVGRSGATPVIRLNQEPPEHFCRPAVDPMLRSAAEVFGNRLLAVVLTGMGHDGADGCALAAKAGGRFVVQDEATSAVWGMPGAAAKTGLAEAVLPASKIAPWIVEACR
ncbi:chemotaxis response regulator protein-glutamate methylesterase [Brevundimonas sp. NIBR11]|uniref:protein-glutamate methylesterase/protein-glutamine glutaminase n=1 Tax=Brevundimonas sp. NIBR11 TaxID=3015999 RepID=UPI0022F0D536|nr:chemotaxis response regulator protein-glutamate methylesterase [Brevundimonas sp. NIBR11]WGM31863.1 Protein-glutamate methylesterase/protein-glutamine glutaminase 2 [Brevundimonas sp. NIBR11]